MRMTGLVSSLVAVGLLFSSAVAVAEGAGLTANRLIAEYQERPLGIDAAKPRLSWRIDSTRRATMQRAYQVVVGSWDSGRVESGASTQVLYSGPELASRTRYSWRVRVWDSFGRVSPWSQPTWFETGLLRKDDWSAKWVSHDGPALAPRENAQQNTPPPWQHLGSRSRCNTPARGLRWSSRSGTGRSIRGVVV